MLDGRVDGRIEGRLGRYAQTHLLLIKTTTFNNLKTNNDPVVFIVNKNCKYISENRAGPFNLSKYKSSI